MKKNLLCISLLLSLSIFLSACAANTAISETGSSTDDKTSSTIKTTDTPSNDEKPTSSTSNKTEVTENPSVSDKSYPSYIKSDFDISMWDDITSQLIEMNLIDGNNISEDKIIDAIITANGEDPSAYDKISNKDYWADFKELYIGSMVTSKNATANAIKNEIDVFSIDADVKGFPMKRENFRLEVLDITVETENGVTTWYVSAVNPDNFNSNEKISWGVNGYANADTEESKLTNGESLLAYHLLKEFPNIKNASIKAALNRQICKSVAFCENRTYSLSYGTDCPEINETGEFLMPYKWNGYNGVNQNSEVIGTSPVVFS